MAETIRLNRKQMRAVLGIRGSRWRETGREIKLCEDTLYPLPEVAFEPGDRPSAGSACAWCKARGHFCPAKGMAGELALCAECGSGKPCSQVRAVQRMRLGEDFFDTTPPLPEPVRQLPVAEAKMIEQTASADWAIKGELRVENMREIWLKKKGLLRTAEPIDEDTPEEKAAFRAFLREQSRVGAEAL